MVICHGVPFSAVSIRSVEPGTATDDAAGAIAEWEPPGKVIAGTGNQANAGRSAAGDEPEAVMLDFANAARTAWRLSGIRGADKARLRLRCGAQRNKAIPAK